MTIDLRKRLEELERENADLRERLRCEREAQQVQEIFSRIRMETPPDESRPRFWLRIDEDAPDGVTSKLIEEWRARQDLLKQEKRSDTYPHYEPGTIIKAAPKPTIFKRLKGLLPWN